MHDTGCLGLAHWDDPEGWYGEGGGRGFRIGNTCTPMADACWCMATPIQYCKVNNNNKIKINKNKNPWSNWFNFVFNVGSLMLLWILCFQEKQVCHLTAIKHFAWSAIVYHPKKNLCNWLENGTWEIYSSSMVCFSPLKHFQVFPSVNKY